MDDTKENNEAVMITRRKTCCLVRFYRRYIVVPKSCLFIEGVLVAHAIVDVAAISLLVTYLTNIRDASLVKATITVNLLDFMSGFFAIPAAFMEYNLGYFGVMLLSTIVYTVGMGILCLSSLRVFSRSKLIYAALMFVALAKAGSSSSESLLEVHLKAQRNNDEEVDELRKTISVAKCKILGGILGNFLIAFVSNWTTRFGISAAVICFVCSFFVYGSPLDSDNENSLLSRRNSTIGDHPVKGTRKPMFILTSSFLIYGIVESIGSTFFLEQGSTMDRGLGGNGANDNSTVNEALKGVPLTLLLIVMNVSRFSVKQFVEQILSKRLSGTKEVNAIVIRNGIGMLFSVICCCIAQSVEAKRLSVVRKNDLLDEPDMVVPMSVFWLLPQYITLGAMKGLAGDGLEEFFENVLPNKRKNYASALSEFVIGTGSFLGAILVAILGKASKWGGGPSWFAETTNRSQLDEFYRLLTIMCLLNLYFYARVSTTYTDKRLNKIEDQVAAELVKSRNMKIVIIEEEI